MINRPKATILMSAYNAERYIKEAIRSVQEQSDLSWELIIRDNGSTDSTGEICKAFASQDARIHVLHNKVNMLTDDGYLPCDREFWPEVHGEYIAYLDSDDILHPDFIRLLYQKGQETGADVIVGGTTYFLDGSDPYTGKPFRKKIPPEADARTPAEISKIFPDVFFNMIKTMWGKLIRKNVWESVFAELPFCHNDWEPNLNWGFDAFWGFTLLKQVQSAASVAQSLHYYRRRPDSLYRIVTSKDVDRLPLINRIYQYNSDCLMKAGMLTWKNAMCIYDIIAGHTLSLLRGVGPSEMDLAQRLEFLRQLITDPELAEPYFFEKSWNKIRPAFLSALEPYSAELDCANWLTRLHTAMSLTVSLPPYVEMLMLYSAVYDRENVNGFGLGELPEHTGRISACDHLLEWAVHTQDPYALLRRRSYCLRMLSGGFGHDALEKREWAAELLRRNDLGQIEAALPSLDAAMPFDPLVICLHIVVLQRTGKRSLAHETALCGHALYPENELLMKEAQS